MFGEMKKDYTTITAEEYFQIANKSDNILAIPAKAISELKEAKKHSQLVSKTLKKYLINARQAQTNAKIVEALLA